MSDHWEGTNQILISYRREDTAAITGRIYDRLVQKFGREAIFKDVDAIPLGINFRKHLDTVISECCVVLVVIGDGWLKHTNESGKSRLDDPRDFVRIEIESALKRDIPIIPLLVHNASMPEEDCLPEALRELAYRNGIEVGHDPHFHVDISRLINSLVRIMAAVPRSGEAPQGGAGGGSTVTVTRKTLAGTINFAEEDGIDEHVTAYREQPEAGADLTKFQQDARSLEVDEIEPEVMRKQSIVALLLGMVLPGAFAAGGVFASRLLPPSPSAVVNDMSGMLLAEIGVIYALVITGFLIGLKSCRVLWRAALLIAAFSIAINLGGSLQFIFRDSGSAPTSLFFITAFFMMPIMPLLAYVGLHLGKLYSLHQAKGETLAQPSLAPEQSS